MKTTTTCAVLDDGRYIRVIIRQGSEKYLLTLNAHEVEPLRKLCYELTTRKVPLVSEISGERSYVRLVPAAPAGVLNALRDALPDESNQLVAGELAEDILVKSSTEIRNVLGGMLE